MRFQSDRRVVQRTADIFNLTTVQASCRIGSPVCWIILTWNRPTEEGHSNVNTARIRTTQRTGMCAVLAVFMSQRMNIESNASLL